YHTRARSGCVLRPPRCPAAGGASVTRCDERKALRRVADRVVAREQLAAPREPTQMGLGVPEGRLMGEATRHARVRPLGLLVHQRQVAAVLLLLARELIEHGRTSVALARKEADEDLVAQRRGPAGPPAEPRAQRALAARGQSKQAAESRADALVAAGDEAAAL